LVNLSFGHLSFGHLTADVVFGAVGVEWEIRLLKDEHPFGLVGVQPLEQPIEGGETEAVAGDIG
jgi:hypothetical protein